jgi:hypothetical protein
METISDVALHTKMIREIDKLSAEETEVEEIDEDPAESGDLVLQYCTIHC